MKMLVLTSCHCRPQCPIFIFFGRGGGGRLILEDFFCIAYSRTDTGACSVIRGGGLLILEDFLFIAYSRTDTGACSVIRTTTGF